MLDWTAKAGVVLDLDPVLQFQRRGVQRAGLQRRQLRRRIRHDVEADLVDEHLLAADIAAHGVVARGVAVEPGQLDVLARPPVRQDERPGADRLVPAAVRLDRGRVQHRRAAAIHPRQVVQEPGARPVQDIDHGVRVRRRHALDLQPVVAGVDVAAAPLGGRVHQPVPGPFHLGRGHGRAVLELHAAAQVEGVGLAVVRQVPAVGQHRPDLQVLAEPDQPLDDVLVHDVGGAVAVDARIGAADVGRQHGADGAAARRLGRGGDRRQRRRRGQ